MTREEILRSIVSFKTDIKYLAEVLSTFSWDSDKLITVTGDDIQHAVAQTLCGNRTAEELEFWADAIEVRDDIGFENESVKEAVFLLANPAINDELSTAHLREIELLITPSD